MNDSNVKITYEQIASHFSETRHHVWPPVKKFIDSFKVNSLVADIGCGNGKNMYRKDCEFIGLDFSLSHLIVSGGIWFYPKYYFVGLRNQIIDKLIKDPNLFTKIKDFSLKYEKALLESTLTTFENFCDNSSLSSATTFVPGNFSIAFEYSTPPKVQSMNVPPC